MISALADELRAYAFSLPGALEDHPWGESVAKVGKKVFVFFGIPDPEKGFGMTLKLPVSHDEALALPFTETPGYGLDRGHWVTIHAPDDAPVEMLTAWIEESYLAVAPRAVLESSTES